MEHEFTLILSTESKVMACNITDFKKQAEQYLSTLTDKFETDDDFARGKEEAKQLKVIEERTREAIKGVLNGSQEISELIKAAEEIAERFRQERLSREKLVKAKEAEVKNNIINEAMAEIIKVQGSHESTVSLAMAETFPKTKIADRINDAAKRKQTIATLQSAINGEKTLIIGEIAMEAARLKARLNQIPVAYEHLFKDTIKLIGGNDDLQAIVNERIEAEKQREAEIKAKAEQAAAEKAKPQVEVTASAVEPQPAPVLNAPAQSEPNKNEPTQLFAIYIHATQSQAVSVAKELKQQFPELKLKRVKE